MFQERGDDAKATARGPRSALGAEFEVVFQAAQSGACRACIRIYDSFPAVAGYLLVTERRP